MSFGGLKKFPTPASGGGSPASSRWVLDLSTDYGNLKTSAPAGLAVTEPTSGSIDSASISSGELILSMGSTAGASFNGTGGYGAPRVEFRSTRGLTDTLEIRGKFRNGQTGGGGSFPGVGIFACKDADAPGADRSWMNSRTNGTHAIFWETGAQATVKSITTSQRDTTGVWVRFLVGSMGGIQGYYSVDTTSDPDSVTWTKWAYGRNLSLPWYFDESEGGPEQTVRFGLAVGMDTANSTSQIGRLMYLDCNIRPIGA